MGQPVVNKFMEITCKYGIPYFSNYINSDLSPEDALSMCCRLRLNTGELRKRGGGLFGSNPLTGSIGVVTVNLPRIGYLSRTEEEFKSRLLDLMEIAKESLEIKRKTIEEQTRRGMYPYSAHYLENVKERTGSYWFNHFNTIGLIGMNEACLNFMGKDITTPEGQKFSLDILDFMRDTITRFQEETGHVYNLEATPAEGSQLQPRPARQEKISRYHHRRQDAPYYTNSTQLPGRLHRRHLRDARPPGRAAVQVHGRHRCSTSISAEQISDVEVAKSLIRKAFTNYQLPYISLTPTFSVCPEHGYLNGEVYSCPECGRDTEVWSRVVGYLRPVQNFHRQASAMSIKERKKYRSNRRS